MVIWYFLMAFFHKCYLVFDKTSGILLGYTPEN